MAQGYCTKCRTTREMAAAQPVWLANGRAATQGTCPVCGTKITRLGETPAHAALPKPEAPAAPRPPRPRGAAAGPAPEEISAPLTGPVEAYCVKCKALRPMADGQAVFMANGRPAARGRCPDCGTALFKIGATPDHAGLPTPTVDRRRRKTAAQPAGHRAAGANAAKPLAQGSSDASERRTGRLVIVESPAKARTVGRFLGRGYTVKASVGHVRDLLRSQLSVDIENNFQPTYRVPNDKRQTVKELTEEVRRAREVYLATDPDREGEAIAWHLVEATGIRPEQQRRVVFHEITREAVADAFAHPRQLNMSLVNAQQARRVLDRLVGYKVSPLLWERVRGRTSAGRVQSVALRLVVEREREIQAFVPEEYWSIHALLAQQHSRGQDPRPEFKARLVRVRGEEVNLKTEADTQAIVADLSTAHYLVTGVRVGERRRRPAAPFTTSTLQQEASRKLGYGARQTMRVAQQLYEGIPLEGGEAVGLITYMRTDSVTVSAQAQAEARAFIAQRYGEEFLPPTPPVYKTRAKGAQEAHEAIRPTSVLRTPESVAPYLSREQQRLYELIWMRFVASQMAPAVFDTVAADIAALPRRAYPTLTAEQAQALASALEAAEYLFRASGSRVRFPGFLTVYEEGRDDNGKPRGERSERSESGDADEPAPEEEEAEGWLPALTAGELLDLLRLLPEQHFTQPPPRYTEATLVKALEEYGIGRPSTYAPIMSTIQERGYVQLQDKRLVPTELGFIVNDQLVKHFPEVFDVGFTAQMEEALDSIAASERDWVEVVREFYEPFSQRLAEAERTMERAEVRDQPIGEACPECGHDLVIRLGRFGKFIACSNYPTCRYTRPLLAKTGATCPKCRQGELVERRSRRGRVFYGCERYPACDFSTWQRPLPTPCPACGGLLVQAGKERARCTACDRAFDLKRLEAEKSHA
ncbi:MAG: type I DNA topoisomerase [Caldilineales bacterium]|nr:type I DNA topoisomerase [Caldilineales bacterium]MDW8317412.1 type I DNA topoisomerase [Anaerolineae bacterium]